MKKFNIGDKVRLISGSPIMTVKGYQNYLNKNLKESTESDTDVVCEYYSDKENRFVKKTFHQDTLEKFD
ncbi:MAG: hypothetical protein K0M40_05130 [Prolixibacteraceae bacterium]|nr:hypothetical protein [Prolixibacteraceae bacterium]